MKKLGLFIALFSTLLLASCEKEKEEENTTPEVTLEDRIIGTWNAERSITALNMTDVEKGTMTFNKDGSGIEVFEDEEEHDDGEHDDDEHDEGHEHDEDGEDVAFTWSINSDNELIIDDEVTLSNDVNEANKLEFSGTLEMNMEDESDDATVGGDLEDVEGEMDFDFGLEDVLGDMMSADVSLKLTK